MRDMAETVGRRLADAWERTDRIFATLTPDALLIRPISLRHPFIFYVGHLPAFAWNHVGVSVHGRAPFNAEFDEVFSRGIDPDVDDPEHCHDHPAVPEAWPEIEAVLAYRDTVRAAVLDASDGTPEHEAWVLSMVLEHELMHQETLLYMVQQLDATHKARPAWLPPYVTRGARREPAVAIPAGRATLGAANGALPFGWDNEFPRIAVDVPAFTIDATPVTNGDFLAFVEDGAYDRPALWREDDWHWKTGAGLAHPVFWIRTDGGWRHQTVFEALPLGDVLDWPVSVSLAEARAYARWKGRRLPTEAEYHRAAHGAPDGRERPLPWGDDDGADGHGNFDFRHWAPTPVGAHPAGASAWGVHDLVGNGWEWTDTPFDGFPGFRALARYPGYSADFFDGKHYVLKGGSWATAGDLVRPSFRNWFQAHYPYVFAKFRCVA